MPEIEINELDVTYYKMTLNMSVFWPIGLQHFLKEESFQIQEKTGKIDRMTVLESKFHALVVLLVAVTHLNVLAAEPLPRGVSRASELIYLPFLSLSIELDWMNHD